MSRNIFSNLRSKRLVDISMSLALALIGIWVVLTASTALAASQSYGPKDNWQAVALQTTPTPTSTITLQPSSVYSFSLDTLGYDAVTLNSPRSTGRVVFRTPQNWDIRTDGTLNLDINYTYSQSASGELPALFGNLTILFDGEPLTIFAVTERQLDRYRLSLTLPAEQLAARNQHTLDLAFDAGTVCQVPHKAALTVQPTSSFSLNYALQPIELDLSFYPRPFFQQAFAQDAIRFVLPADATDEIASQAVAVAAKLGDLTNNRLDIKAITDAEFSQLISESPALPEHLLVIGTPQENQLITLLNDSTELPVSLHRKQLDLISQGPDAVAAGDTFTYVYTFTNTIDQPVTLSLTGSIPDYTQFVECTNDCSVDNETRIVTWSNDPLEPEATATVALTLEATNALTGTSLEHMVTLTADDIGPVNADMLTSAVVSDSAERGTSTPEAYEDGYFFTYQGQVVAKDDGIVQEVASPWNENQAILILTGLTTEALEKASRAMSSETSFPGMSGPVALVQDALPFASTVVSTEPAIDSTLEDLGYPDQVVQGEAGGQADYFLDIPPGWELTEEAYVDLYFVHSRLITYEGSSLTVLFNRDPIASIPLDEETATAGYLRVSLADVNIQTTRPNRLSVRAGLALPPSDECAGAQADQAWLLVKNDTKIFLPHNEKPNVAIDLGNYPNPFSLPQELTTLLLALPGDPTVEEWQTGLRLAASLGRAASGQVMVPAAILGDNLSPEALANYNIIAIGRPSRNALIQQINEQLPQPFLPNSDEIEQKLDNVVFRLSPGVDLGYIQLLPSPWNEERALLALTGTTDQAVQQAFRTLVDRSLPPGDLIMLNGDKISALDSTSLTRAGLAAAVATAVPEMTPTTLTEVKPSATPKATPVASLVEPESEEVVAAEPAQSRLPGWLIPLIGANGLLVVIIIAFVFWRSRQNRV